MMSMDTRLVGGYFQAIGRHPLIANVDSQAATACTQDFVDGPQHHRSNGGQRHLGKMGIALLVSKNLAT